MASRMKRILGVAILLVCSPGCAVLVENRYSVFGFAGMETDSPEEANSRSRAFLAGVAITSAVLGAVALWIVQRAWGWWWKKPVPLSEAEQPSAGTLNQEGEAAACPLGASPTSITSA